MNFLKNYLINILENALYRLRNDECTAEEIESVSSALKDNLCTYTTIDNIAKKYNKPNRAVHDAINRHRWGNKLRPKRIHLYKTEEIEDALPLTWERKKKD